MKETIFAGIAATVLTLALVGCGPKDNVNEPYTGVPSTKTCAAFYKLPANVAKCTQESGRH